MEELKMDEELKIKFIDAFDGKEEDNDEMAKMLLW